MVNSDFQKNLNKPQKDAVNHLDGPLLIVAGAGSGKTKVLTSRIANIIKQKKAFPNQILAVTFTNKAAKEMQSRVSKILGSGATGLILEANLIQKIVSAINTVMEKMQSENRKAVMITAPVIRRDLSHMLRQHIPSLDVLSFTELPDNKKIEVVANIGSEEEEKN